LQMTQRQTQIARREVSLSVIVQRLVEEGKDEEESRVPTFSG
jgi:hypothetical protein